MVDHHRVYAGRLSPRCNRRLMMTASGDEEQFSPPRLNARCWFGQETIAGMHGNEQDASIADLHATTVGLLPSTRSSHSATQLIPT